MTGARSVVQKPYDTSIGQSLLEGPGMDSRQVDVRGRFR